MNDNKERLARCFEVLFPQLGPEEIYRATQETVKEWDSVAAITLLQVIEDEFQVQIDFEVLGDLSSFAAVLKCLDSHVGIQAGMFRVITLRHRAAAGSSTEDFRLPRL